MFSRACNQFHVFPSLLPISCFPRLIPVSSFSALVTSFMFFCACHQFHIFSCFRPVSYFSAIANSFILWNKFNISRVMSGSIVFGPCKQFPVFLPFVHIFNALRILIKQVLFHQPDKLGLSPKWCRRNCFTLFYKKPSLKNIITNNSVAFRIININFWTLILTLCQ